jgi:uncharacterized membrane protein YhiD involved in acid resistance
MEHLTRILQGPAGPLDLSLETTLLALTLSFVLGQLVAWVYMLTHSGLSYSRSFTQSLVLLTMIAALVMFVIGNSLVTAFGLIGALAIIRFRNVLKDTRDTAFVFMALVVGMAVGSQRHVVALVGIPALLAVVVLMQLTGFGRRRGHDGHLSLALGRDADRASFREELRRHCRRFHEVSAQLGPDSSQLVLEIHLRDRRRSADMVEALRGLPGIEDVALVRHEEILEP